MKFFVGDETDAQYFNWLPNPDLVNNTVAVGTQAYEIYTNRLRWISVAYAYDVFNSSGRVNVSGRYCSVILQMPIPLPLPCLKIFVRLLPCVVT